MKLPFWAHMIWPITFTKRYRGIAKSIMFHSSKLHTAQLRIADPTQSDTCAKDFFSCVQLHSCQYCNEKEPPETIHHGMLTSACSLQKASQTWFCSKAEESRVVVGACGPLGASSCTEHWPLHNSGPSTLARYCLSWPYAPPCLPASGYNDDQFHHMT